MRGGNWLLGDMQGANVFAALVVLTASAQASSLLDFRRLADQSEEQQIHRHHRPGDQHHLNVNTNEYFAKYPKLAEQLSEILRPFFLSAESSKETLDDLKKVTGSSVEILPLHPTSLNKHTKAPLALILSSPKGHKGHRKYVYNKKNKHGHVKANVEISNVDSDEKNNRVTLYNGEDNYSADGYVQSEYKLPNVDDSGSVAKEDESNGDGNLSIQDKDDQSSLSVSGMNSEGKGSSEQISSVSNEKPVFQGNIDSVNDRDDSTDTEIMNESKVKDDMKELNYPNNLKGIDDFTSADYIQYDSNPKDDSKVTDDSGKYYSKEIFGNTDFGIKDMSGSEPKDNIDYGSSGNDDIKALDDESFKDGDDELKLTNSNEMFENEDSSSKDSQESKQLAYSTEKYNNKKVIDYKHNDRRKKNHKKENNDDRKVENNDNDYSDLEFTIDDGKGHSGTFVVNLDNDPGIKEIDDSIVNSTVNCPTELKKLLQKYNTSHKSYNLSFMFHR